MSLRILKNFLELSLRLLLADTTATIVGPAGFTVAAEIGRVIYATGVGAEVGRAIRVRVALALVEVPLSVGRTPYGIYTGFSSLSAINTKTIGTTICVCGTGEGWS